MLDIIDRYIIKLFIGYFLGTLLVLVTLFMTINALSEFVGIDTSLNNMLRFYAYSMPAIVYQMLPAVCMIAVLFTLGGLNKNSELIALFSVGNSLARISAPMLIIVSIITVGGFWMSDRIVPYTNKKKNYVWYVEIRDKPDRYYSVKDSKIWYRQKNVLYNIKTLDPEQKKAFGLSFYYFDDDWNLVQTVTASEAVIMDGAWDLRNGSVAVFTKESSFPMNQSFASKKVQVSEDLTAVQEESKRFSEMMSINELRKFIKKNKESGLNTLRYEVDLHSKFGYALASFIMAFIAIPFSVTNNRTGGRMISITICIGLAFVYWSLLNTGLTLGRQGYIPPLLSAWIPNIFMIGFTSFLILRLKK